MFPVSSVSSGPISLNFNDEILLPNFNEISKTRCSAEKTFTILSNSFEEYNESTTTTLCNEREETFFNESTSTTLHDSSTITQGCPKVHLLPIAIVKMREF